MIDSHHCNTRTRVRFTDDLTPVRIVHRIRPAVGKVKVRDILHGLNKFNLILLGVIVNEDNSLITASYSKRLHADTLETVTGYPALSYPVHLSHVFTAP